jgi:hypothetical protein
MQTHSQEHIRSELIQLTEKQISTMEKRTFGSVTEAELSEYDERQERIRDLFIELHHLDPAA